MGEEDSVACDGKYGTADEAFARCGECVWCNAFTRGGVALITPIYGPFPSSLLLYLTILYQPKAWASLLVIWACILYLHTIHAHTFGRRLDSFQLVASIVLILCLITGAATSPFLTWMLARTMDLRNGERCDV